MSGFFGKVFGAVGALSSRKSSSTQNSQEQPTTTAAGPNSKKRLFEDEEDEDEGETAADDGKASAFAVNEEFARRFEHNKKREERQKLEEKYGRNAPGGGVGEDNDDSSSEDESEDEDGYLLTEELDARMNAALEAIKNKDPRIYNTEVKFFDPAEAERAGEEAAARAAEAAKTKEKPVFLTDYHRERYLRGDVGAEDDDDATNAAPPPTTKTYQEEQDALKQSLLAEMNASDDDDDDEEDDEDGGAKVTDGLVRKKKTDNDDDDDDDDVDSFIIPKASAKSAAPAGDGIHPARAAKLSKAKAVELDVAGTDKNPELFLSNFLTSRAWAAAEGSDGPNGWTAFESDEDDDAEAARERAEAFETAYNLRFEDPDKSNEVLKSYSRSVVAERSVRRDNKTARQRQRDLERAQRDAEKQARREERARLRKLKLDEAREKLAKIKEAAGLAGRTLNEDEWSTLLDDAWDNDAWEAEMRRQFGDTYYAEKDADLVAGADADADNDDKATKKPKKPKWDDDIDIKDIVPDFDDVAVPKVTLSDAEDGEADGSEAEEEDDANSNDDDDDDDDGHTAKRRKTGKDRKQDRADAKRAARRERARLEAVVERKLAFEGEGPSTSAAQLAGGFRYRETSPQAFGLTPRDILLAPSDAALNEFAGLKKLATFRDAERKRRDRKKLGKKARLRQWRRETFGDEFEQTGPTFGFERFLEEDEAQEGGNKGGERRNKKKKTAADSGAAHDGGAAAADADGQKKKRKRSGRKNKDKGKGVATE